MERRSHRANCPRPLYLIALSITLLLCTNIYFNRPPGHADGRVKGPVIGIDIGSTHSSVAVMRNGTVQVITDKQGNTSTPTWITFTKQGPLVGRAAKDHALDNPGSSITGEFKRLLGRNIAVEGVVKGFHGLPFDVVEEKGHPLISITTPHGKVKKFSPEQLMGMMMRHMKDIAEEFLDEKITQAVVTVPTGSSDAQRQGMRDAGKLAGLNILRVVNESTAAALAYGLDQVNIEDRIFLVCHLGGMITEVTVTVVDQGVFEVLGTASHHHLGGQEFDHHFLNETLDLIEQVLKEVKLTKSDVRDLILIGGINRISNITSSVEEYLGLKALEQFRQTPEEPVVHGAAIQGGILANEDRPRGCPFVEIIPLSLGIETTGGLMTPILKRYSHVPNKRSQIFSTEADEQLSVLVNIVEGERVLAKDNRLIGSLELQDILPAPHGVPKIEVVFEHDAEETFQVTATDLATGRSNSLLLNTTQTLSSWAEAEKPVEEAEHFAAQDQETRKQIEPRVELESLILALRARIHEGDSNPEAVIFEAEKQKLCQAIGHLERWISFHGPSATPEQFREEDEKLSRLADSILGENIDRMRSIGYRSHLHDEL